MTNKKPQTAKEETVLTDAELAVANEMLAEDQSETIREKLAGFTEDTHTNRMIIAGVLGGVVGSALVMADKGITVGTTIGGIVGTAAGGWVGSKLAPEMQDSFFSQLLAADVGLLTGIIGTGLGGGILGSKETKEVIVVTDN